MNLTQSMRSSLQYGGEESTSVELLFFMHGDVRGERVSEVARNSCLGVVFSKFDIQLPTSSTWTLPLTVSCPSRLTSSLRWSSKADQRLLDYVAGDNKEAHAGFSSFLRSLPSVRHELDDMVPEPVQGVLIVHGQHRRPALCRITAMHIRAGCLIASRTGEMGVRV